MGRIKARIRRRSGARKSSARPGSGGCKPFKRGRKFWQKRFFVALNPGANPSTAAFTTTLARVVF
jgi:hypothetical protein